MSFTKEELIILSAAMHKAQQEWVELLSMDLDLCNRVDTLRCKVYKMTQEVED